MEDFKKNSVSQNNTASFFDPIKNELKTFSNLVAITEVKAIEKDVLMIAERRYLAIISKDRWVDPKEIFSYPLHPIPWSHAC